MPSKSVPKSGHQMIPKSPEIDRNLIKNTVIETIHFFRRFLGRPERSSGWAHMQSVRAGSNQTHFSVFARVLKNGSRMI